MTMFRQYDQGTCSVVHVLDESDIISYYSETKFVVLEF